MPIHKLKPLAHGSRREASFTLLETLIALGIMVFLVMEVGAIQGNAIYFTQYGRRITQAGWLAKSLMSQVEYQYNIRPFEEMESANIKEAKFEDFPDYTYDLEIKEWKLPLLEMLSGGGKGEDESSEKEKKEDSSGGMMSMLKSVFGDQVLKTANVQVYWSEGAKRQSFTLTLLLTNVAKLNQLVSTMKDVADKLDKPAANTPATPNATPNPNATPSPTPEAPPN